MIDAATVQGFAELFRGCPHAYGTGRGGWVHAAPNLETYKSHLRGSGEGLGIGPLTESGTCWFAAIDLDRPDFALAGEMMKFLPGVSWLERSRSGNAHVLVFFSEPIEAWVVRGILREACAAVGERAVEVFPKSDFLHPGMVGNYLNLPYFGDTRPVVASHNDLGFDQWGRGDLESSKGVPVRSFVTRALITRNDPEEWRKRARWLGVPSPKERELSKTRQFGNSPNLHMCAEHVIANRETNPVVEGYRAVVYFTLAKQLSQWSEIDHDEAAAMLALVNDASPDPISSQELGRILRNAERGQFTSLGCDDPLFLAYAHPDCPIVKGI